MAQLQPNKDFDTIFEYVAKPEFFTGRKPSTQYWQRGRISAQAMEDGTKILSWDEQSRIVQDAYGTQAIWGRVSTERISRIAQMIRVSSRPQTQE